MQPLFGLPPFKLIVHGLSETPKYAWLDAVRAYVPPSAIEAALTAGETLGSEREDGAPPDGAAPFGEAAPFRARGWRNFRWWYVYRVVQSGARPLGNEIWPGYP